MIKTRVLAPSAFSISLKNSVGVSLSPLLLKSDIVWVFKYCLLLSFVCAAIP